MVVTVFESPETPKVTLTSNGGVFTAVLEVADIDPGRLPSAEETALGVLSLAPPTVVAREVRALIDGCQRAVQAAISSTTGDTGGPSGIRMVYLRTALAVREALRKQGNTEV
jgi:hypothetical protein